MPNQTPVIKGFVETLVNNRVISGWAYLKRETEASSGELVISVYRANGSELIGTGRCTIPRTDLTAVMADNTFGFHIMLDTAMVFADLASVTVNVSSADDLFSHELNYTAGLQTKIARSQFQRRIRALTNDVAARNDSFVKSTLKQLMDYDWNVDNEIENSKKEATQVCISVGEVSREKIAVAGREGHFFLYAGSNNLDKLYARRGSAVYKQWTEILQTRQKLAAQQGIKFLQLIIPEKQSLLPALYPVEIQVPTENLDLLEKDLATNNMDYVLSGTGFFSQIKHKETVFKKTDTHFSTAGAHLTVSGMLTKLNLHVDLETDVLKEKLVSGDLGNKYLGAKFTESVQLLTSNCEPVLIEQHNPPQNAHTGIMRIWKNENAPNKLKVVVFGNSFFERGGDSTSLSWWFSRLFSEFHFYWSNSCDWTIVEKEQPDVLICQTIERFLTRVPTS